MTSPIRISKEHSAKAKAQGKIPFVIGFGEGKHKSWATMYLTYEDANLVWAIAHNVNQKRNVNQIVVDLLTSLEKPVEVTQ